MPKTTDSVIFSDAEQEILELALQNPDMSNSDIADETGYRLTLIRDTRREYEEDIELAEDVAEAAEAAAEASTAAVDDELSETEQVILDLVAENPQITNADIAEKTGARVALVRDTRDAYGDQIDTQPVDDADEADSEPSGPGEPSAAQQEILSVADDDPSLSNADIAEETGARITLVRDTLAQYDGPSDTGGDGTADAAAVDTDIQAEIAEAAAANPEATNRELAEQTGARITLVRDTLAEDAGDDAVDDSSGEADSDDGTDVLDDVDTSAFSGAQLRILETHLSNPELTNAEVAAETDTRVALVRDTIHDHEYDDKPWVGNVDDSEEEDDEDDDEIVVDSDDEVVIPDTTASDEFNDRQRAILETALKNPELTNAEIAEQTGARLALVRDTRETYEAGVDLADSDDDEETASTSSSGPVTFTEKQKAIIAAAKADEEASIAAIAAETDSRIPLVRDTLAAADEGDVDAGREDDAAVDDAASDDAAGDDAAAEPSTDSTADSTSADGGGTSDAMLVAIVIAIILLFGVGVMLL